MDLVVVLKARLFTTEAVHQPPGMTMLYGLLRGVIVRVDLVPFASNVWIGSARLRCDSISGSYAISRNLLLDLRSGEGMVLALRNLRPDRLRRAVLATPDLCWPADGRLAGRNLNLQRVI